jgi:REP element-mobilizing transposase RayT
VENCWFEIPKHYPKVVLHEFIVMPNHFHWIIEIVNTNNVGANDYSPCTWYLPYAWNNTNTFNEWNNEIINNTIGNNLLNIVGTNNYLPYVWNNERANNHSPLQKNGTSKTIGAIVRGLKIGITKQIWFSVFQRNYYEHIVRDENSYYKIVEYIENNVLNWEEDRFYEK